VRWGSVHGNRPHGSELHWLIGGACRRPWLGDIAVALAVEDESKSVARLAAGVRNPGDGRYGTSVGNAATIVIRHSFGCGLIDVIFTPHSQAAVIIKQFLPEPIGSPLVRVLFTKGMIAADFLGDTTGTGLDMPSQNAPSERSWRARDPYG
jgi:hypothetical protein